MKDMKSYLGAGSKVSGSVKNYEHRQEQIDMAEAVAGAIEKKENLLVEAGTGVGKSFAYLVPFMLWATEEKERRVVISTHTKTLQQQLVNKDIPSLSKIIPAEARLCVGSGNYICLKKYYQTYEGDLFDTSQEREQIEQIQEWLDKTESGLNLDIDFNVSGNLWSDISRDSSVCMNRDCYYYKKCYFYKSRRELSKADILVSNHHLLLSDIASGGHVLPPFEAVVFDEAHNLEDIASRTFELSVSASGINKLLGKIHKSSSLRCLSKRKGISESAKSSLIKEVKRCRKQSNIFFAMVMDELGFEGEQNHRIHSPGMFENGLSDALLNISKLLYDIAKMEGNPDFAEECFSYAEKFKFNADILERILSMDIENYVYYIKVNASRGKFFCSFNATPIEVAGLLKELVFEPYRPVVMTSATLTANNSFEFIKSRTGMSEASERKLESPFDYSNRVLFYAPDDIPDPSFDFNLYAEKTFERISSILNITCGRTFVLFTSYSMLNRAAGKLINEFPDLNFLIQGRLPRYRILENFKKDPCSVLLGTSTFWQGIDAPGRMLECVIITKLPFASPADPVIESRVQKLRKAGRSPFLEYQVPSASLLFKQGFGRLIRHRDDFGIVAVLDSRLRKRRYGSAFLSSLPECRNVDSIELLKKHYKGLCENLIEA
ncbi:MAG: ATP-dependent DNA helicase [Elusimicrobiota bacterium]